MKKTHTYWLEIDLKNSFYRLHKAIFLIALIIVTSCKIDDYELDAITPTEDNVPLFNPDEYEAKDVLASRFAKNLAKSMLIPEINEFIRNEISGKDDGLNAAIFQTVRDKPLNSKSELARGGSTFGEILENVGNESISHVERIKTLGLLDSLKLLYPTLHIAIPDFETISASSWDGVSPLRVAYMPDKFAFEIDYIEIFDQEGNVGKFNHMEESEELIIVIGPNYKVIPRSHSESNTHERTNIDGDCFDEVQPFYSDDMYSYYDARLVDDCNNNGGPSYPLPPPPLPGNDPNQECEETMPRWTSNRKEMLVSFRYEDINKFREYHGSLGDTKPHVAVFAYGNYSNQQFASETLKFHPSRSDLRNYSIFGSTTKDYVINHVLIRWDYKVMGDRWKTNWEVEGSGATTTVKLGSSTSFKAQLMEELETNRTISGEYTYSSKDNSRGLGERLIEYCNQSPAFNGTEDISFGDHFRIKIGRE